jgi:hypothetical protein
MSGLQNCSVFDQQQLEIRSNFVSYSDTRNIEIRVMNINGLDRLLRSHPCNSRRPVVEIPTPLWGR